MNRLDGKIALITGSTQGLGKAIAVRFAQSGVEGIVTCGRSVEKGKALAAAINRDTGIPVRFVRADLANVDDCRQLVAEAENEFQRIDILVNSAAMTDRGTILDTSQELFDRMFAVNVRGPYFLIQEAVKVMIRAGVKGSIVNIGTMSAHAGQPFISAYCASKGALTTLTRNTAFALLRNNVRVNQLNIGWMASDGEDAIQKKYHDADDNWLDEAAKEQPAGRLIDPDEVARAVAFLASDDSGLMTGSVINFDQSVWGAFSSPPVPDEPLSI